MATYDDLRAYFDESPLRSVANEAAEIPIVTGFTLDVDPLWSFLYDIEDGLIDQAQWPGDARGWWEYGIRHGFLPDFHHPYWTHLIPSFQGFRRRDLHRAVKEWQYFWSNHPERLKRSPVRMTIVHRPLRALDVEGKEGADETSFLRRLIDIASRARSSVIIDERPRARMTFVSGDRIHTGPNRTGTLGGFLHSPNGSCYGVTCSHVAQKGDTADDDFGTNLGTCIADSTLVPLHRANVCDPVTLQRPTPYPGNGPDLNMLDCALLKMSTPATNTNLSGVASQLSQGMSVTMRGAETGHTYHRLGSLCLSYQFTGAGNDYCYRDAIELIPRPRVPIGGALGQMTAIVPVQGDSGSWVVTDDTPAQWAGMLFGADSNRGFMVRAAWALDWARNTTGEHLAP